MEKIKGRLIYCGWDFPWELETENSKYNIFLTVEEFFKKISNQPAFCNIYSEDWEMGIDPNSQYSFFYNPEKKELFFEKNLGVGHDIKKELDRFLLRNTGRLIIINQTEEIFGIYPDLTERAYELYREENEKTKSIKISKDEAETICQFGQNGKSCIFLSLPPFHCEKFNEWVSRRVLEQFAETRSGRIANCVLTSDVDKVANCRIVYNLSSRL
ncbi:MAG: hypothetical protein PHF44_03855 [Candidatus Pacebacteria bacterium]|nr:hypothetical protein [Candidatus Paceibacterota bacterium]